MPLAQQHVVGCHACCKQGLVLCALRAARSAGAELPKPALQLKDQGCRCGAALQAQQCWSALQLARCPFALYSYFLCFWLLRILCSAKSAPVWQGVVRWHYFAFPLCLL